MAEKCHYSNPAESAEKKLSSHGGATVFHRPFSHQTHGNNGALTAKKKTSPTFFCIFRPNLSEKHLVRYRYLANLTFPFWGKKKSDEKKRSHLPVRTLRFFYVPCLKCVVPQNSDLPGGFRVENVNNSARGELSFIMYSTRYQCKVRRPPRQLHSARYIMCCLWKWPHRKKKSTNSMPYSVGRHIVDPHFMIYCRYRTANRYYCT